MPAPAPSGQHDERLLIPGLFAQSKAHDPETQLHRGGIAWHQREVHLREDWEAEGALVRGDHWAVDQVPYGVVRREEDYPDWTSWLKTFTGEHKPVLDRPPGWLDIDHRYLRKRGGARWRDRGAADSEHAEQDDRSSYHGQPPKLAHAPDLVASSRPKTCIGPRLRSAWV